MIYIRKQIGNRVVVFHTNDIRKDVCVHVGIGEIDVNSNTIII